MNTSRLRFPSILLVLALIALGPLAPLANIAEATGGSEWYASPGGSASASGSISSPLSLTAALSGNDGKIKPGDTIWLRSGTYGTGGSTHFFSTMSGTANSPIYVRQ